MKNKSTNKRCLLLLLIALNFLNIHAQKSEKDFIDSISKYKYRNDVLAIQYIKTASKLFKEDSSRIKLLRLTGDVYWKKINYDSSIYFYEKGMALAKKNNSLLMIANFHNDLGYIYMEKNEIERSLQFFINAQKIANANDFTRPKKLALSYMGNIYSRLNDTTSALKYLNQVLQMVIESKDENGEATLLNNIGNTYYSAKDYPNALKYYKKSAELDKKNKVDYNYYQTISNIAIIYAARQEHELAIEYFNIAVPGLEKNNNIGTLLSCHESLARIYFRKKDFKQSEKHEIEFLKLLKLTQDEYALINYKGIMAPLYAENGDYEKAYEYSVAFYNYQDSINKVVNVDALAEQKATFDLDKKQNEIDLLNIDKQLKETEAKKKQLILYFFIGFSVLMIITVYIAIRSFINKKRANKLISQQREEAIHQKDIIAEHQKEILDSIHYAKRIQNTLLAHKDFVDAHIPQNFIYFNPKDIVSGDFYWAAKKDNFFFLATCDSTGHGVPGAFMSLLNIGFLSEAINEKNIIEPSIIFNFTREKLISSISKDGQKDGFDGILIRIDTSTSEIIYAAANNNPVIVSGDKIIHLPADKMPVGYGERKEDFSQHIIQGKKGDMLYLYTDGYADQFGGPKGKKYKYKQLDELLAKISKTSLTEQSNELKMSFDNWKGDLEQVDDVCVIGIKL